MSIRFYEQYSGDSGYQHKAAGSRYWSKLNMTTAMFIAWWKCSGRRPYFLSAKPWTAAEEETCFCCLEWRLTFFGQTPVLIPQLGGSTFLLFQQQLENKYMTVDQLPVFGLLGTCCLVSCRPSYKVYARCGSAYVSGTDSPCQLLYLFIIIAMVAVTMLLLLLLLPCCYWQNKESDRLLLLSMRQRNLHVKIWCTTGCGWKKWPIT